MNIEVHVTNDLISSLYASLENCLPWQSRWYHRRFDKFRYLHKGRQIGASDYFALEALLDACLTGENKTFVVPEPNDCDGFMCSEFLYMARHASVDKLLLGNEKNIHLSNGAKIYFISDKGELPDSCGDVYLSEWAWFDNPKATLKKAKVMSAIGGVIVFDTSDIGTQEKEVLLNALREASKDNSFKNLFLYGSNNNALEVIPLSRTDNKGRITLYSSRATGDNGHEIDSEQMFNGFYDVVPNITFEVGHDLVDLGIRHSWLRDDNNYLSELYLCKIPSTHPIKPNEKS